ncbi:RHS repeat domain-containing protein [Streptomyces sp. NPDC005574]|uniref:RHS repeat domain-containing protein n=1 Tax=Streptomyces sp. NPDC005574 TaxID=3156891 RepID=UPI0033BA7BD1
MAPPGHGPRRRGGGGPHLARGGAVGGQGVQGVQHTVQSSAQAGHGDGSLAAGGREVTARTTPDGARHTFAHDTELRLVGVTNPTGLSWSYEYDAAGRLSAETDFDDRTFTGRCCAREVRRARHGRPAGEATERPTTKHAVICSPTS